MPVPSFFETPVFSLRFPFFIRLFQIEPAFFMRFTQCLTENRQSSQTTRRNTERRLKRIETLLFHFVSFCFSLSCRLLLRHNVVRLIPISRARSSFRFRTGAAGGGNSSASMRASASSSNSPAIFS